jgi:hypothetical protein
MRDVGMVPAMLGAPLPSLRRPRVLGPTASPTPIAGRWGHYLYAPLAQRPPTSCRVRLAYTGSARLPRPTSESIRSECRRMSETEKPLREQMTEAMEKIRQRVDLLRAGPTMGRPSDDRSLLAELEAEYQALDDARAKLSSEER